MAWTSTTTIVARVHAAIGHDLDPSWSGANETLRSAGEAVNDGRGPLASKSLVEAIHRYSVPPDQAASSYAERGGTGMVVGVSLGTEPSRQDLRGGANKAIQSLLPVEVALVRVLDGLKDVRHAESGYEEGSPAYDLDRAQELIIQGMQERKAHLFGDGVQTVSFQSVGRLGVEGFPGWIGRLLEFEVQRNMRNITATSSY